MFERAASMYKVNVPNTTEAALRLTTYNQLEPIHRA